MNIVTPKIVAGISVGALLLSSAHAADSKPKPSGFSADKNPPVRVESEAFAVGSSGFGGGGIAGGPGSAMSFSWALGGPETEPKGPVTYLGIAADIVSEELAAHLPLDSGVGLVVRTIGTDSPAAKAGIHANDVLTKIDEQILVHPKQLQVLVRNRKEGDKVTLSYIRKGEAKTVEVELVEREAKEVRKMIGSSENTDRIRELISSSRERFPGAPPAPAAPPLFQRQTVVVGPDGKVTRLGESIDVEQIRRDVEKELEKVGMAEDVRKQVSEALKKTEASIKKVEAEAKKAAQEANETAEEIKSRSKRK